MGYLIYLLFQQGAFWDAGGFPLELRSEMPAVLAQIYYK
jgi:hypothetical protein